MSVKSICYAAMHDSGTNTGASKAAVDLAARLKAHLTVALGAPMVFSPTLYPSAALAVVETEVNDREKARVAGIAEAIRKNAQLAGVTIETHILQDALYPLYGRMAELTRVADLTVADAPGETDGQMREFVEELVRSSGGGVLMVPGEFALTQPFGRVMVAWDGGVESARAARFALPFLREAASVEVVSVAESRTISDKPATANLMAAHLARHCKNVTEVVLPDAGGVTATLSSHASNTRTDLLVMGFYGHSRLREWVLGGATRDMLRTAKVPVLFGA